MSGHSYEPGVTHLKLAFFDLVYGSDDSVERVV